MQGAAIGREPTLLQNDLFYTKISSFVKFPLFSPTYLFVCLLVGIKPENPYFASNPTISSNFFLTQLAHQL